MQVAQLQDELKKLGLPIKGMGYSIFTFCLHNVNNRQERGAHSAHSRPRISQYAQSLRCSYTHLITTAGAPAADDQQDEVRSLSSRSDMRLMIHSLWT